MTKKVKRTSKAFVDTTILTDVLLKPSSKGRIAKEALAQFDETLLPVYAIKEFKAGPLYYFKWFHNKLATTRSFYDSLGALHAMALTPKKYLTATTIEALREAVAENLKGNTNQTLVDKYGARASSDETLCDMFRLSIKVLIMKGWKRRRTVTTSVVNPLTCYSEVSPYEQKGLIEIDPTKCKPTKECCLGVTLRKRTADLKKLVQAIKEAKQKPENDRRHRVLHEISRKPTHVVTEEYCRGLGDAYFALFCPTDAAILSTNISDHGSLAEALDKTALDPTTCILTEST